MGLESATYISDLVTSNPSATDLRGQGDDHIRLLKAAAKATFPNASKPFYFPTGTSLQTSTVTVATTDDNKLIPVSCEAAARTVNLPQGSTLPDGFTVRIVKADHSNNVLTIDGYSSELVNGATTVTLWQRYQTAVLQWVQDLSAWMADIAEVPAIGTVSPYSGTSAPTGWVMMNGLTIGDASSSATGRANADTRGLFYHLWASYSNTYAAVSTGRGVSAAADFDAHKTIVVPSMQGRVWAGLDDMGATAAGVIGSVITNDTTNGETGGTETITLSSAESGQKTISAAPVTISDPTHNHATNAMANAGTFGGGGGPVSAAYSGGAASNTAAATGITATFTLAGSAAASAHSNMQPSRLGSWMIKL